jgi:protoporphyrinogen oxidase
MPSSLSVVCIGAGPAGLTAGYLLGKEGAQVTVLEQNPRYVGGISRTETYKGFGFDIGGHRFFSKSQEVEDLWDEILPYGFLKRPRKSRIFYRNRLFDYPLRAFDALRKLGVFEATRCVLSYARVKFESKKAPGNFEEWVTDKFGKRLFEIFFRTYTEKVWGMRCTDISADWAAQRIKGLSLSKAIWHALMPQKFGQSREKVIKTLVGSFRYPRLGPGMLWEAAAAKIQANGGNILLGLKVTEIKLKADGTWHVAAHDQNGVEQQFACDHVISSMPMRNLVRSIVPALPHNVSTAAEGLRYRDFLTVALILKERNVFDDNWIYIHDPGVKVGRIQNFKSWSPELVPDPAFNCYGLEYFCFEGDGLWTASDSDLIKLASAELVQLGLAIAEDIVDGSVVRQPKAYPVYDSDYRERVSVIRAALQVNCQNLHLVGRNGLHKYNNQDHAMMTAMLTAKNILAGRQVYDVWFVNQDAEYHEDGEVGEQDMLKAGHRAALGSNRLVPSAVARV